MNADALDLVLSKLDGVRASGGSYSARCPAHDDGRASLSVKAGERQPVVLHCHAGCTPDDVAAAAGLDLTALCAERDERQPSDWPHGAEAVYPYHDERGAVLYRKVRNPGKKFYFQHPNGAGWRPGMGGKPKVLYRLPDVLGAVRDGRPVYVVEGEKDADAVRRAGAVATCNYDGASKDNQAPKVRDEYGAVLTGADVIVWADDDEPGMAHARAWQRVLLGRARSVRLVKSAAGKDAHDHLANGRALADAVTLDGQPEDTLGGLGNGWEDPLSLADAGTLPEFPVDALPGWLASMITAVSTALQVPADLPACLGLGALSTAAGRQVEVAVRDGWDEPVNLYVLPVLESGERKTATFKQMIRPVDDAEKLLNEPLGREIAEARVRKAVAAAAAKQAQKDAEKLAGQDDADEKALLAVTDRAAGLAADADEITVPSKIRLVGDDITPEELASVMHGQRGRLAILAPEGDFFNLILGLYGGVPKLALFKRAHSGDTVRVNRREREEYIERPALTLCVSPQPSVLPTLAAERRMRGEGALARVLYSIPDGMIGRRKIRTRPVPAEVRAAYDDRVKTLVVALARLDGDNPARLTLTDDADKALYRLQERTEKRMAAGGDLFALRDWGGKLAGAAVRLAGLLHLAEECKTAQEVEARLKSPVSGATMKAAIRLADYFTHHAFKAFGIMHADPLTDHAIAVLDWIGGIDWTGATGGKLGADIAAHPGQVTRREIAQGVWCIRAHGGVDYASAVMRLLEKTGHVRPVPFATSPRWHLHPSLLPSGASTAGRAPLKSSTTSTAADSVNVSAGQIARKGVEDQPLHASTEAPAVEAVEARRESTSTALGGVRPAKTLRDTSPVEVVEDFGPVEAADGPDADLWAGLDYTPDAPDEDG